MTKTSMEGRETFDLPLELKTALKREAARTLRSKADIIREALMVRLNWKPKEAK